MKQLLLLSLISLCAVSLSAQPTLTAAGNNPVIGDIFNHNNCSTTGVVEGPSGSGVTWDFSSLSVTDSYEIKYVDCSTTPFCDTFPGTNVAENFDDGIYYTYYNASADAFTMLGYEGGGFDDIYSIPFKQMVYPITYGTTRFDTSIDALNLVPYDPANYILYKYADSFICDGWGTLILPSGTYTNVLRVHQIDYVYKIIPPTTGAPDENENYYWYSADFHDILLEMYYGYYMGRRLTAVVYADKLPEGVSNIQGPPDLIVSPNPATDHINLTFTTAHASTTTIAITDVTGRQVLTVPPGQVKNGKNSIECSLSGFPAGMYLVQVNNEEGRVSRKIVIGQ